MYLMKDNTMLKYVGYLRDAVYRDPLHLCNYTTKKCLHFNRSAYILTVLTFYICLLYAKIASLCLLL